MNAKIWKMVQSSGTKAESLERTSMKLLPSGRRAGEVVKRRQNFGVEKEGEESS